MIFIGYVDQPDVGHGRIWGRSPETEIIWTFIGFNSEPGQCFFKWANPGHFFVYFRSFQANIVTIFTTNKM